MRIAKHLDSDKQHLNGREVILESLILEADNAFDAEVLPMAIVRTADTGEELVVYPDELDSPLPLPDGYIPPALRELH